MNLGDFFSGGWSDPVVQSPPTLAPSEDSPGKGSRDILIQPAESWWTSNVGGDYSLQGLQDYLNKSVQQTGDPWADLMLNFAASNNDVQWMPKYQNIGGKDYVTWGSTNFKNDDWTGLLGQAFGMSGPWALAGAAAAGASALGDGAAGYEGLGSAGLSGSADFVSPFADVSWGVNPQTGGNMDWFDELLNNYNVDAGFQLDPSQFNNYTGELLRDISAGPAGTNLQDLITKFDSLPPGTGQLAKSALGKILSGQGGVQDWTSLLGALGATGLGVYGANKESDALTQIANQSRADRAPFLNAATGWMNNPESYYSGAPAQAAMKGVLQGLSVNGNPASNPTAMASATEAGLRNWQNAVTGFGNLGLAGQDSRNALLSQAAQSQSGVYDALGYGLNQLTQPKQSLSDLARAFGMTGLA